MSIPTTSNGSGEAAQGLRRRTVLGLLGAGAAGVAVGASAVAVAEGAGGDDAPSGARTVDFYGEHQAGIATAGPQRVELAAFDLGEQAGIEQVRALMRRWTPLAAALTQGQAHPDDPVPQLAANPALLTVTVGFGPGLFDAIGRTAERPAGVAVYPPFAKDELQDRHSGGDLLLQVCGDDALSVSHAVDALASAASPAASPRWRQAGFRPPYVPGQTPRNLMGSKDGTANDPADSERFSQTVWAAGSGYPAWYVGGTTLVLRRIRMELAGWGAADERTRERTIGRSMDSGAPLGEQDEFDPVPLQAQDAHGSLQIPSSAHVRIAHPDTNSGARMFRRGYNYVDGAESGLLFMAIQADATRGFIPVMSRMASGDDLNRFVTHVGSAVFAIPPGVAEGGYWGEGLLA